MLTKIAVVFTVSANLIMAMLMNANSFADFNSVGLPKTFIEMILLGAVHIFFNGLFLGMAIYIIQGSRSGEFN